MGSNYTEFYEGIHKETLKSFTYKEELRAASNCTEESFNHILSMSLVCLSECTIVYEHKRVDKIRVDSTWQHVHM